MSYNRKIITASRILERMLGFIIKKLDNKYDISKDQPDFRMTADHLSVSLRCYQDSLIKHSNMLYMSSLFPLNSDKKKTSNSLILAS